MHLPFVAVVHVLQLIFIGYITRTVCIYFNVDHEIASV